MNGDPADRTAKALSALSAANISFDEASIQTLGEKLARAAEWYRIADAPSPPRERKRLEAIEKAAEKLSNLLASPVPRCKEDRLECRKRLDRLEHDWRNFGGVSLQQTQIGLASLRKTVEFALKYKLKDGSTRQRQRGGAILRTAFGSSDRLFISRLAKPYETATGRVATVSFNSSTGKLGGPFVRFVQESARQFGVPPPSAETIKEFTIRRKKRGLNSG